ncbi:uncharacterized protein ACA1_379090 [Acanthamoeba castellanii str. Neff]|uniref:Transmembrane protein n=1 Tax=Acanthamoeba castellanii (strain ATCC 30010 / Neff) TaxID=1257118 RepID=L8GSZ5_ACACF|nr:uncharacterized protein ACA1_379090 [Acanthamoeba castellanii str. Neff]ELR15728.1 hypothetical protein ACA1_379090 [Acanthamoeba castellanii str. Neff]
MATGGGSASRMRMMIVGAYLVAVNVGAAGLFYYDKQCAIRHQWRVRESTLQLSALAGGWAGGILAMQTFRHKTAKSSFQVPYYTAAAANMGLLAFLARTRQGRQLMDQFFQALPSALTANRGRGRGRVGGGASSRATNTSFYPSQHQRTQQQPASSSYSSSSSRQQQTSNSSSSKKRRQSGKQD